MSTLTSPATYRNGVIKPITWPAFDVAEILVTFIPAVKKEDKVKKVMENIVEKTSGICPNLPPGIEFENETRKSWDERYKKLWQ